MPEAMITLTPEEVEAVLALREESRIVSQTAQSEEVDELPDDGGDDDGGDDDDGDDDDGECPECGARYDEDHDIECSFYDDDDDMENDDDDDDI